jgi:co-chaperonin GroES (HSP10)
MASAPADDDDKPVSDQAPLPRVSRHIQPVGPRVLVRIVKEADRSQTGLFLPAGVKEANASALLGEVVEVARTMPKADPSLPQDDDDDDDDDDEAAARANFGKNVSGIPLGANVLFEKDRGVAVPWDENLRILEVRHVLALVDIISQDEIQ